MCVNLELATTEQLIHELLNRKTFAGVLVFSPETHRFPGQCHEQFKVVSSCEAESTVFLLEKGLEAMHSQGNGQ